MAKKKVRVPDELAAKVLFLADRTCCVCRDRNKRVQIHHIDDDPSNNDEVNLAVLCLGECHTETQLRGGFDRKLDQHQVILYRDDWNRIVALHRESHEGRAPIEAKLDGLSDQSQEIIRRLDLLLTERMGTAVAGSERPDLAGPPTSDGFLRQAIHHQNKGEHEEAIVDSSRAIQLNPEATDAYFVRGESYRRIGSYEQSVADFTTVIDLQPDNPWVYYLRGKLRSAWIGQHDLALSDFDRAISLQPDFARAYASRGSTFRLKQNYKQSIEDLEQSVFLDPSNLNAWYWLGLTYSESGESEKAIERLSVAIRIEPEYINAYFQRGIEYFGVEEFESAIHDLTKIIQDYPYYDLKRFRASYVYRGWAHCKMGRFARAIEDFGEAIRLEPHRVDGYCGGAEAYLEIGQQGSAIVDYQQALKLSDSDQLRKTIIERLGNLPDS